MQKLTKVKAVEILDELIKNHQTGSSPSCRVMQLRVESGMNLIGIPRGKKEFYITHGLPDLAEALGEELKPYEREPWKIGFEYDGYFIFNMID